LRIDAPTGDAAGAQNALNLAGAKGDEGIALRLLADGQSMRLPVQYRFLSFFKILELRYLQHDGWKAEFADLIARYQPEFEALKTGRASLKKVMFECRDKCAHIRTGKLRSVGVYGADATPSKILLSILPIVRSIAVDVVNEIALDSGSGLRVLKAAENEA
jgi:hypothetical protein